MSWNKSFPTLRTYPPARRSDHIDKYRSESKGDVRVPDPYQWLEEYTKETNDWTSAQESFTRTYLDAIADRARLEENFRSNMDYSRFSAPTLYDDRRWYWYHNSGLQAQSILYRSKGHTLPSVSLQNKEETEIFFDPNVLSSDGTAALTITEFSKCGKFFAYGISYSGSDFSEINIRSTDSPLVRGTEDKKFPETIKYVKFSSITWTKDSKGFFYQRFPSREKSGKGLDDAPIETGDDLNAMVYYHRIGTPQSDDILVYRDKENPKFTFGTEISTDGRYLSFYVAKDSSRKNDLWIADLTQNEIGPNIKWVKLFEGFEAEYNIIANHGTLLYIRTNESAPQYRVITLDLAKNKEIRPFIAEDPNANLSQTSCVDKDKFVVVYKRNVKDEIYIYSKEGSRLSRLAEDFVGAATIGSRESQSWFFVTMTGFNTPGTIGRYDFASPEEQRWSIFDSIKVKGLSLEDFQAQQVWYESKDGVKVPMFIVRHKDTPFDGTAPAIQYGYGGFSISIDPFFSPTILTFLQTYGAILAVPNIRGGGEFGEDWHKAGSREEKFNCFDDFIAATEFLTKNKYVAPGKVVINGGSNGGLLVAACVNRAPEGTFGAAVADVGVLDLLKFHKFTIGRSWVSDYGDPNDPHDFDFIYPLSPLHNIPTDRVLPPLLLTTADHDDRVVPMHSFKHAATLQHTLPDNPHPLLIRIDKKSGHGAGKSTEKKIQEAADKWGFAVQSLGLEPKK